MADSQRKTDNLFNYLTMAGTIKGFYLDSNGNLQESRLAAVTDYIPCSGGKFSLAKVGGVSPSICLYDDNKQFLYGKAYNTSSGLDKQTIIVNTSFNASYIRFSYFYEDNVRDDLSAIMLNSGSTALPYEPYGWQHSLRKLATATEAVENPLYSDGTAITSYTIKGNTIPSGAPSPSSPIPVNGVGELETTGEHSGEYKIPILSGGVTTNIYLGSTQTVRQIKKMTFTGDEDWRVSSNWKKTNTSVFYYERYDMENTVNNTKIYVMSDKFEATSRDGLHNGDTDMIAKTGSFSMTIRVSDSIATTVQEFKAWLASNPVTAWYVLATPETVAVNEPLMKIGDYSDTLSNATSIPTTEGANSITVDTTVQPSEFSATWTVWHNANVKEWDGSQWG